MNWDLVYLAVTVMIVYCLYDDSKPIDNDHVKQGKRVRINESANEIFFKDTKFSGDCCPSPYTSSGGCACLNEKQVNTLNSRGGNNI